MKYLGILGSSIFEIKVFGDSNITKKLKYPCGKKDGNKLGRRKRELTVWPMYYTRDANLMIHPDCINSKEFKDSFGCIDIGEP